MKPGFALTLSDDGIRLLHRTNRGWMLVGDADLEDATVEDTLRILRKTATALAPEGVTSKLVLPNSQILYTEIAAPGPDEAARRAQIGAALAENTPYPIDDLAYDWSGSGDTVKVAVVTRLTLAEAESFAEDHGFNPVCFVSIPEGDSFDGEPFFGLTSRAEEHLPLGDTLERDTSPVRIVGLAELPKAPVAAKEPDAPVEVFEAEDGPLEGPLAGFGGEGLAPAEALAEDAASDGITAPEEITDVETAETTSAVTLEHGEALGAALPVTDIDQPAPATLDGVAAEATTTPTALGQPEAQDVVTGVGIAPEDIAPAPLSAFAQGPVDPDPGATGPEAAKTIAAGADLSDEVPEAPFAVVDPDGPLPGDESPETAVADFTSRRKLPFGARPEDTVPQSLRHTAPRLGGMTAPVGVTAPVVADSADAAPAEDALPDPAPGAALGDALRKRTGKKPAAPRLGGTRTEPVASHAAAVPPAHQPPLRRPVKTPVQESEELTIFGARRGPSVRGKPRYLGPVLIGGLIALIGLVGLWSSLSGSDNAQPGPEPATLEQSALQPGATPDQTLDGATATAQGDALVDPQPTAEASANEQGSDPALADANLDATTAASPDAPAMQPVGTATAEPTAEPGLPPETITATGDRTGTGSSAAAVTEQPAAQATAPAVDPVAGDATAPAATGTYAAQSQPDTTAADSITAESAPATPDATRLPAGQALLHDAPLAPQPLPLPYGALVKYGADGLIIPSKEGVQTPSGITLYLGKPPVAPKIRPAKVSEAAAAAAAVATPEAAPSTPEAAAAPVHADPKLKGKKPAPRPATLPTAQDQGAATPEPAPLAPVDPRHATLKPKDRPAAILARAAAATAVEVAAPAATADAAPAPVTGGTRLAVAQSRRPSERPSDVSKAVQNALAAAVAEPESAPEPLPVVQVTPEPAPTAAPAVPKVNADSAVAEAAAVEIDEPEPVTAAPSIPTRASVAKQATYANAIDLGKINLIGIMGSTSDRRALIRTSNGRYVRVKVGDRFDGGRVASIGNGQLTYVKGGKTIVLRMLAAG